MRSWVWIAIALVGGYFAYDAWFADEEAEPGEEVVLDVSGGDGGEPVADGEAERGPGGPGSADAEGRRRARRMGLDEEFGSGPDPVPPRDDEAARALARELEEARDKQDGAAVKRLEERLLAKHPESNAARWLRLEEGKRHLAEYHRLGATEEGIAAALRAWRDLTPALFITNAAEGEKARLRDVLGRLADVLLFSSRHIEGFDRTYEPRSGDNLTTLCRRVFPKWGARLSPGFVASVNGLASPRDLRAGEPIKVPLGRIEIVVVKHEFRLYVLFEDCYVRDFPVGLGKNSGTPVGRFEIGKMMKNPDWYPRPGVRVPYGDPENVLGTRWMGFKNTAQYRGFGIHGTKDPKSIGREESSGCVRMLRADVERLYAWARPGTTVRVLR